MKPHALIFGVGDGLSASLARALTPEYDLTLAARSKPTVTALAEEIGGRAVLCDASDATSVANVFAELSGVPRVVVYNPSARVRGPVAELDPEDVRRAIDVTAFGAFLVGQQAAKAMQSSEPLNGVRGTILFTGASAGVKGFPQSAAFAMGKFAQRGLAQSMARELHPKGIHVVWINIDGAIRNPRRTEANTTDAMLDPDAIAQEYLQLVRQHRSAWSNEHTLRPWVEKF